MKWFNGVSNVDELKKAYKNLAKKYHPDLNKEIDTTEQMKEINNEYEALFEKLNKESGENNAESAEMFMAIIDKLVNMEGVVIEIIGSWLWVSGNTYEYKDQLKAAGMRWSKNKKCWYWHEGEYKKKGSKKSLDEIRNTYGSEVVKASSRKAIA